MRFVPIYFSLLGFVVLSQSNPVTSVNQEDREADTLLCIVEGGPSGSGIPPCPGPSEQEINTRTTDAESDSILL